MLLKRKKQSKLRKKYDQACSAGFCPKLEEIENSRIKELANRLKANSIKETLTNISEWQNNNIHYWLERYPLPQILLVLIAIFTISLSWGFVPAAWLLVEFFGTASLTLFLVTIFMITYYRKLSLKHFYSAIRKNNEYWISKRGEQRLALASLENLDIPSQAWCVCRAAFSLKEKN